MSQPQLEPSFLERLDHYAKCIGLAFQIRDDILNVIGTAIALGKSTGSDRALCKPTYPTLLGLNGSREHTKLLCQDALASLDIFGSEAELLRWIARFIIERAY
jgi:geranylgeranyl pyrophosphate synthase